MIRTAVILAFFLFGFSPALASISWNAEASPWKELVLHRPKPKAETAKKTINPDTPFKMTADTEVQLDGETCTYDAVPRDAIVIFIELAADEETIHRIHFRSRK